MPAVATPEKEQQGFLDFFSDLKDPRIDRRKLHPMAEILLVTLCGVIAGCEGWEDIELFGKSKLLFLKRYLPYKNGIPSDDTLRRFFRALDPTTFVQRFIDWVKAFQGMELAERVVALDGKTSRRSYEKAERALHVVSAFASEARMVLGQKKVDGKTNEITAIPELLDWLDIRGAIVTIDAMGCQKTITEKIQEKKGDYVLALKGNQETLRDEVKTFFEQTPPEQFPKQHYCETVDGDHGRIETRRCWVTETIDWLIERNPGWCGLRSIICIESTREVKGATTKEVRYYISSLAADAKKSLQAIRLHWGVENSLHWILDMSFGDDQMRIRQGNAAENMVLIKKCALNMIQQAPAVNRRSSVKRMRKAAGWDDAVLESILSQHF